MVSYVNVSTYFEMLVILKECYDNMVGGHVQETSLQEFFYKVIIGDLLYFLTKQLFKYKVMCFRE